MKYIILCSVLILSGCAGMPAMETISNVFTAKNVADEIGKPKPEEAVDTALEEEKFYSSSHNWNNTKTVKVEPTKIVKESKDSKSKQPEKRELRLPWPLLIIFLLSGTLYFINMIRIRRLKL